MKRRRTRQATRATHPRHVGGRDRCAGCHSDQRAHLDADLLAGVSQREIARRYLISRSSIQRHRAHIPTSLVVVQAAHSNGSAPSAELDVVAEARRLYGDCRKALDGAVEAGNLLGLSLAAREVHRSLDLLGKQLDRIELRRGAVAVLDLTTTAEWIELRTTLLHLLEPYPDAWAAVARGLAEQAG